MSSGRNVIICSDGTGNTFDGSATNVTRLVKCLAVEHPERQLVFYDQGVGTTARREKAVEGIGGRDADRHAAHMLPAPMSANGRSASWLSRGRGLLFGYGLKENVRQMYCELARRFEETDKVFLFGFSRGAFTVRALAGLLHRCHLPQSDARNLGDHFERAWRLYQPMAPDADDVAALRAEHRPCPIHFLGVWDTVKSYGGLDPVILPHLRHNPDVKHVRHALALDERRAWFKPTTWGQLDSDRMAAMTRLDPSDALSYERQDISEVWFSGCHSDIGGGDREADTARVSLRWMVAEAATVEPGAVLNDAGLALLHEADPPTPPTVHQSWTRVWRAVELLPRKEIDNSGVYPVKVTHRGSDGVRDPQGARRADQIHIHESVRDPRWSAGPVSIAKTKSVPWAQAADA